MNDSTASQPAAAMRRNSLLVDTACACLAAGLALAAAAYVFKLWDASLHVPMSPLLGDVTDSFMIVKMLAGGSWFQNDLIGAPVGTAFEDYPFYWDLGQVLGIKWLGVVSQDPAAIFNASYVLSYPAIAFNAYVAMRWTGARRGPSVLVAVLFATLPAHFLRGQAHFYIGQYWAVAYSAALVYKLIAGHPLVTRRAAGGNRLTVWLSGTTLATLAAALASGVQFGYYAIFTIILIALVGAIRLAALPARSTLVDSAVALGATGVSFAVMLAPTLLYRASNGTNELVANRTANEAEFYGLKLSQLLLPISDHRIGAFADKAREYATTAPSLGEGQSTPALGLLLGGAFVASFVVLVVAALRSRELSPTGQTLRAAGLGGLLCFLLGTIGGGSSLFNYLISSQLRGWGRISVFLAFFAAIALAAIVSWLLYEYRGSRRAPLAVAALCVLGVLGVLDQSSPTYAPAFASNQASWNSDGRFVVEIERRVPRGAQILQLPYQAFPEAPSQARATDFDLFRPHMHSEHLRWSYGAMKGRSADWGATSLAGRPLAEVLPEASAAGFAGAYVDTYFFDDGGTAVLRELADASAQTPIRSADGRMAFVTLEGVKQQVTAACPAADVRAAGQGFIRPLATNWGPGFYPQETDGRQTWHWAGPTARLDVSVPKGGGAVSAVEFRLGGSTGAAQTVTVQAGSQAARRVTILPGASPSVSVPLAGGGGKTSITISTDAPDEGNDPRDLRMRVLDLDYDRGLDCLRG